MELANIEKLADELIELRCGRHSVGNLYHFLVAAYGDKNRAKADFMRFLSGDLPYPMLEAAVEWISEEQGNASGADAHTRYAVPLPREMQAKPEYRKAVDASQAALETEGRAAEVLSETVPTTAAGLSALAG
jgi:hypothetical protein